MNVLPYFEKSFTNAEQAMADRGPHFVFAIILLIGGWWLISIAIKALYRIMSRRNVDPTLRPFLKSLLSISLKILLLLSVASQAGIHTTSFVAVIGAAGLTVGLALQGSLSNFAGGILILIFKPFKVGDYIASIKHEGTVEEIQVLYTTLRTSDNKKVIIPNGALSNNEVVNFSTELLRRVDLKIRIGHGSDVIKAKQVIENTLKSIDTILIEPLPIVGVSELTENAVILVVWIWVKKEDYFKTKHATLLAIKHDFDQNNIKMPFPELEDALMKAKLTI